uniref:Large ribosomal subunit protein mL49 n=1 Tax=Graphocephala atropunctata TaxID=36148 RepID=A0A1B6MUQ5_9HEMI
MMSMKRLAIQVLTHNRLTGFNKIIQLQTRAGSYKNSKPVEDTSNYTEFEIIHNPEEWKYVERLLPIKWIPDPEPKESYPSGWRPQKADPEKIAYFVERTKNHMLPVYLHTADRGRQKHTKIRRIEGDIWRLSEELVRYIKPQMGFSSVGVKVEELRRTITLRGDFVDYSKTFLVDKGF